MLTAGSRFDQEKARAEGKPIAATVVTLLVTPEDAERISLAANEGQIMLTLRNPLDVAPTATSGVRMANLLAAPAPPVEVKRVEGRRVVKAPRPRPLRCRARAEDLHRRGHSWRQADRGVSEMSVRLSYPIQRLAAGALLVGLLASPDCGAGGSGSAALQRPPRRRPTAAASSGSS